MPMASILSGGEGGRPYGAMVDKATDHSRCSRGTGGPSSRTPPPNAHHPTHAWCRQWRAGLTGGPDHVSAAGQAQPETYLPEVATTLHSLGGLYRDTQRPRESEQAYQEALTTYRQLAQTQPQAYLPQVAMTLHNLGIVRLDQEDVQQAQTLMTEALTIRRAMWKHRIGAEGNDMGQSLAVEIMLSQR